MDPLQPPPPTLGAIGVQAFLDQARWVLAYHDKRSEVFGQRAATILAFDGALLSLLVVGLLAIKNNVDFTSFIVVNVVVLATLPILSSVACLVVLFPRKVTIPETQRLRNDWTNFCRSDSKLHMPEQVVHALLGGNKDPLASTANEARSRGSWFRRSLLLLVGSACGALGVLAVQLLIQQA